MNPVPVVLSIQDMSSIGRCSLTVAMPLLSAFRLPSGTVPNGFTVQPLGIPKL